MSEQKATRTVVVTDPAGVHARTAVDIVKVVRKFRSKVVLSKDRQQAEGTDVLQMLSLGMQSGSQVLLEATGPDAEDVLDAMEPLFAEPKPS
ncbi:MAG: HPr family phosphocarrier protein [Thermoguttaceae bacterium]|jgi:phosphotransferase system HPr (HPr) family protein